MDKAIDILNEVVQRCDQAAERFGGACAVVVDRGDGCGPLLCIGGPVHAGRHTHKSGEESYEDLCPNIRADDVRRQIDRLNFLMPELTDDARAAVLLVAEAAPKRALDRASLDAEQRKRDVDGEIILATMAAAAPGLSNNEGANAWQRREAEKRLAALKAERASLDAEQQARETERTADGLAASLNTSLGKVLCRACACERDGVCNHGSPHTCGGPLPVPDVMLNLERVEDGESTRRAAAVHAASERLGFVYLVPGSDAYKAREDLFAALGAYFGEQQPRRPALIEGAARAVAMQRAPALMPGEPADEAQARRAVIGRTKGSAITDGTGRPGETRS